MYNRKSLDVAGEILNRSLGLAVFAASAYQECRIAVIVDSGNLMI